MSATKRSTMANGNTLQLWSNCTTSTARKFAATLQRDDSRVDRIENHPAQDTVVVWIWQSGEGMNAIREIDGWEMTKAGITSNGTMAVHYRRDR